MAVANDDERRDNVNLGNGERTERAYRERRSKDRLRLIATAQRLRIPSNGRDVRLTVRNPRFNCP